MGRLILMLWACVLLTGCFTRTQTRIVKVPVTVPCIEGAVIIEAVPLKAVNKEILDRLIAEKQYTRFFDLLSESLIISNAEVKGLKGRLEACK